MNARPYNRAEKGLNPKNIKLKKKILSCSFNGIEGREECYRHVFNPLSLPKSALKKIIYLLIWLSWS